MKQNVIAATVTEAEEAAHAELGFIVVQRDEELDNQPGSLIPKGAGWGDSASAEMFHVKPWLVLGPASQKELRRYVRFMENFTGLKNGPLMPGFIPIKITVAD